MYNDIVLFMMVSTGSLLVHISAIGFGGMIVYPVNLMNSIISYSRSLFFFL